MRINLFSGPGVGKSSTAAFLFHELKIRHIPVELVTEWIKSWAWQKIVPESWDPVYVFAKQLRREDLLVRRGLHLVTDSPILMCLAYMRRSKAVFQEEIANLCKKFEEKHPSLNILLSRTVPYQEQGRYENYQQAVEVDNLIQNTLQENKIEYLTFDPIKDKMLLLEKVLNVINF